ncbi:acyltransferase [Sphaerisporangium melleum]|uniref:Acyltransferase n=1 Tax=Sphaerisporangium melleum TaxID=321316 RepID=A0A917VKR7_9ACTN|nr:acyltransferase [Sphaerisporangium melleum]GGK91132.1 acyltransferase [Sphaerisporangium melleum]GII72775.1 acyltransferase [Sphaerisporangium melleum]
MVASPSTRAEAPPPAVPPHLNSLTGTRFLAAMAVFGFHALCTTLFADKTWQMMPVPGTFASYLWEGNWASVSFFFILSGFVLTWSMRPGDTTAKFWRRRVLKIWPNHLLTFAAAAILFGTVLNMGFGWQSALLNVSLLHAFFPPLETWTAFNSVSWSLSNEAFFYLLFPFLVRYIGRIRPQRLWAWATGVIAVIFLVPLVATLLPGAGGMFQPWTQSPHLEFWFTSKFPPVRLLEFVFGIIMARIVLTGRRLPVGVGGSVALTAFAYVVGPHLPLTYPQAAATVIPLGLLIANMARADLSRRPSLLHGRVMVWLGEVSFAFYMCHLLVIIFGTIWLTGGRSYDFPAALGIVALLFLISLALAAAMFHLVEQPIMRRFAGTRRAGAALVPAPAAAPAAAEQPPALAGVAPTTPNP